MEDMYMESTKDDLDGRYLTFYIAESTYGIELRRVIEIIQVQPITEIPRVPHYIKGVINLRGKIVPVIDVRLKFDKEELEYGEKTCIIVVMYEDMQVGLIIDSVSEVVAIEPEDLAIPPNSNALDGARYVSAISSVNNRVVLIINCDNFFYSDLNVPAI